MEPKDPNLASFRAGDFQRRKPARETPEGAAAADQQHHYPFLEGLLEREEAGIEAFQSACQQTCRNLDTAMNRQADPETTVMCQAALAAYGHSLKLLAELLEIKYAHLRQQAGQK